MTHVVAGAVLAGKYRLESLIGRGGMGSVWRAEHLTLDAPVAIKVLNPADVAPTSEALSRFHREARAAAAIRSPHVVQILDHGVDSALGAPFIVMELMDGESLAQRLTRSTRIDPADVARIFTHVARALSRAHEAGIVHRDLKPDNVFLVRNEDEEIAKVLDFGIAKLDSHRLGSEAGTRTGAIMGTAYYMSPEQITGAKQIDLRTDLWAFGVMACECLTGVRPFEAENVFALTMRICMEPIARPSSLGAVPPGFDDWFERIVNRDPALRFSSAREASDALRQVCLGEVASVPRPVLAPLPQSSFAAHRSLTSTEGQFARSASGSPEASSVAPRATWLWFLAGGLALTALVVLFWLRRGGGAPEATLSPNPSAATAAVATRTLDAGPPSVPLVPPVEPEVVPSPVEGAAADVTPKQAPATPRIRTLRPAVISPVPASKPKPAAPARDLLDDR